MTKVDLEDSIPLPIGTEVPQRTVTANPIIEIQGENIEVRDDTESGWPSLITLDVDNYSVGIAIDYLGTWHKQETGMEEVDLLLFYKDEEWFWRAVVSFGSKKDALDQGRYEIDGYNGYELVPWNMDGMFEKIEELLDENISPIAYTEDHPEYPALAIQGADDIDTLNRMFGIDSLDTLKERRKQIYTRVVPRKVRWRDEDTSLRDLARSLVDDEETKKGNGSV